MADLGRIGTTVVGVGRALTGAYFLAQPAAGAKAWVGDSSPSSQYLTRAVGARDLVIGLGALAAVRNDESAMAWILASVVGDVLDAGSGALMLDEPYRQKTIMLAGGFGVLGAAVALALRKAS